MGSNHDSLVLYRWTEYDSLPTTHTHLGPVPTAVKVGTARSNTVKLPEDHEEAVAVAFIAIAESLDRLNLNPVRLFNLANKKKAKYLTKSDIKTYVQSSISIGCQT